MVDGAPMVVVPFPVKITVRYVFFVLLFHAYEMLTIFTG